MSKAFESIMTGLNEALDYTHGDKSKAISRRNTVTSIKPVKKYSKTEVKNLRNKLNLSQRSFADVLGVSVKTVEAWESGKNSPAGSSSRVIELMEMNGNLLHDYHLLEEK